MNNVIYALYFQARDLEERVKNDVASINDVVWAWDALHARALHCGYTNTARMSKIKADRWAMGIK